MSFLDKLKFWKPKAEVAAPVPVPVPVAPSESEPPLLIEAEVFLEALAAREDFNRTAAMATDSAHQRDKHMDRADEDAWIAGEIRKAMK